MRPQSCMFCLRGDHEDCEEFINEGAVDALDFIDVPECSCFTKATQRHLAARYGPRIIKDEDPTMAKPQINIDVDFQPSLNEMAKMTAAFRQMGDAIERAINLLEEFEELTRDEERPLEHEGYPLNSGTHCVDCGHRWSHHLEEGCGFTGMIDGAFQETCFCTEPRPEELYTA